MFYGESIPWISSDGFINDWDFTIGIICLIWSRIGGSLVNSPERKNWYEPSIAKVLLLSFMTFLLFETAGAVDPFVINGALDIDPIKVFNDGFHPITISFNLTTSYNVNAYQLTIDKLLWDSNRDRYGFSIRDSIVVIPKTNLNIRDLGNGSNLNSASCNNHF